MDEILRIFATGISGVFIGMTMLYCSIKLTTFVTEKILLKKKEVNP